MCVCVCLHVCVMFYILKAAVGGGGGGGHKVKDSAVTDV